MKPMTTRNVEEAFSGESQAHLKYLAFADKAEKEGFPNVARLFRAVAHAEVQHAHYHLRQLQGIQSTAENLKSAYEGEDFEIEHMYPAFAAVGELEGEQAALRGYHYAVEAEKNHRPLYEEALAQVEQGQDSDATPLHVCGVCGHTGLGDAPDLCPICQAPKSKFSMF